MTLNTLKNLPLLEALTTPLSSGAQNYYANTFAQGSGPQGTYLLTDFMGTAVGVTAGQYFTSAAEIINAKTTDTTLDYYIEILDTIIGVLDGTYGDPGTGPITIPTGPGSSLSPYPTGDDAITQLVIEANAEISNLNSSMGSAATTLNGDWNSICARLVYEANNQSKASLVIPNMQAGDKLTVMSLITSLGSIGQNTEEGMSAQFFEEIANVTTLTGQSIIASLREGQNDAAMDAAGVEHDNTVPDLPTTEPPQAELLPSTYTVTEARAASAS